MKYAGLLPGLMALLPALASAQQEPPDSLAPHRLRALVVTAERVSAPVRTGVSAVTRLSRSDLRTRPVRTLAEAIQQAPGVAFVDFAGTFTDPQAIVRGFYGGGEADYMLLLVDGRPLNALETGRINWDLLPVSAIESVEVVRGPSSAAWGDAALGGVINVITRRPAGTTWRSSLQSGSHGLTRGSLMGTSQLGTLPVSGYADLGRSNGFRSHADRSTATVGFTLGSAGTPRGFAFSTLNDWREFDEPGPLTSAELAAARAASSPFHRFDRVEERSHFLSLNGHGLAGRGRVQGSLTGELRTADRVRTLRLSPDFADTKNRALSTSRLAGTVQWEAEGLLARSDAVLLGVEAAHGRIESDYYDMAQGPADAYDAPAGRGQLSTSTTGRRSTAAGFARYALQVAPALQFTLAGRLDWLRDAFDSDDSTAADQPSAHLVLSPRAGTNLRYADSERHSGHVYLSVAHSFKAATPDQLYDRRLIPVPFEPYQIALSNAGLDPQRGLSYEAGLYHETVLAPGALSVDLSLAAYQIDLRKEIDFDINTFSYRNLGRSRHRGVELGVNLRGPHTMTAFTNYTLQSAVSRTSPNQGKYLKAIPRHFLVLGAGAGHTSGLAGTVSATHARRTFLDDVNALQLPNWTRWDARLAYRWRNVQLTLDAFNLLNDEYNTTGYPDAGGADVYYYPAARRTFQVGLSWGD
jgi:outer membrane receptor protein involved in Fe transport